MVATYDSNYNMNGEDCQPPASRRRGITNVGFGVGLFDI